MSSPGAPRPELIPMPDFGDGSPREGYGALDQNAPSVANGQISPEQWAAYQKKRKRDQIIGILSLLGATTGMSALGGALGGGSAGAAAGGALPAIEGGAPWAVTPFASAASMAPSGAAAVGGSIGAGAAGAAGAAGSAGAGAVGAAGGAAETIAGGAGSAGAGFLGMGGSDIAALIAALTGTVGGALSNRPNTDVNTNTMDPSLKALIDMQTKRMNQQQPLYESTLNMANGLLPTQYQKGGGSQGGM